MYSFAGTVLGDDPWLAKIHLAGDTLHQSLGTGDDRCDLKRSFQKLLEKQGTHETRTVVLHIEVVQSRSGGTSDTISPSAKICRVTVESISRLTRFQSPISYRFRFCRAVSSVVEHYLDTVGVRGSKPLPRTIFPLYAPTTYAFLSASLGPDCNTLL